MHRQCNYACTVCADASSGLSPEPVAQIPVQATVLCSRIAGVSSSQSDCSLNITQLAVLKVADQPTSVFFEASVSFDAYPWPTWTNTSEANGSIIVDAGLSSSHFAGTLPPSGLHGDLSSSIKTHET